MCSPVSVNRMVVVRGRNFVRAQTICALSTDRKASKFRDRTFAQKGALRAEWELYLAADQKQNLVKDAEALRLYNRKSLDTESSQAVKFLDLVLSRSKNVEGTMSGSEGIHRFPEDKRRSPPTFKQADRVPIIPKNHSGKPAAQDKKAHRMSAGQISSTLETPPGKPGLQEKASGEGLNGRGLGGRGLGCGTQTRQEESGKDAELVNLLSQALLGKFAPGPRKVLSARGKVESKDPGQTLPTNTPQTARVAESSSTLNVRRRGRNAKTTMCFFETSKKL
jgi:hypothetical protein